MILLPWLLVRGFPAHEQPVHTIEDFQRNEARLAATQYQPSLNMNHMRMLMMNTLDRRMGAGHWWQMVDRLTPHLAICYGLVGFDQAGRLGEVAERKGFHAHIEVADDWEKISWIFVSKFPIGERKLTSFGYDLEILVPSQPFHVLVAALDRRVKAKTKF